MTNSADLASCESADIKRRILELIEGASSIAISGHTSPDGDALGSVLGLGLSLMKFFPNKDIALLLADDDPVPRIYRFMEGSDRLVPASAYTGNPDLFISVDVPVVERLNNSAEVLRRSKHVVCFDHHPAREEFAELSLRRVEAAACAMIIDRFLDNCGIVARDGVATCLLCGLVTDTGRFQYQNADAAAFHAASRLVAHGADPARVALEVYQSMRVEFLHLKSIVMGRNGIQGKASRGLGRKLLDRMTSANGNNTGGRAAQRGNVRGALAGAAQIASERTDIGTLAHRERHGPHTRITFASHGDQVGGIDLDGTRR